MTFNSFVCTVHRHQLHNIIWLFHAKYMKGNNSSYCCYLRSAVAIWVVQCYLSLVLIVGIFNRYNKNKSLLLLYEREYCPFYRAMSLHHQYIYQQSES